MQYIQQAILATLAPAIERNARSGSFVSFTDQTPNQRMAQVGSYDGSLATLDLSEASDRVANWHVEELFQDWPHFLEGVQACRSTRVKVPSGEVIPLQKFASMGSALTFPMETMIFLSISLLVCGRALKPSPRWPQFKRLTGKVRAYGDDIIVPAGKAEEVIETLETFGFKVNRRKSFWTGPFRESCGKEYFGGQDVSIVRSRQGMPSSLRSVRELVSLASFRNLLCEQGYLETVAMLDEEITTLTKGHFPAVHATSPIIGRVGPDSILDIMRVNKDLQRAEVQGYAIRADLPKSVLDGVPALMKCLAHPEIQKEQPEHLTRSGRPRAASLKLVWAPVF
jgi:hypothetical protein